MRAVGKKTIGNDQSSLANDHELNGLFNKITLSEKQRVTMHANFSKQGIFYESEDVHTMLDCGPSLPSPRESDNPYKPKPASNSSRHSGGDGDALIANVSGRLRQEFFGGIFFDYDKAAMFYLDDLGFAILAASFVSKSVEDIFDLAKQGGHGVEQISLALSELQGANLVTRGSYHNETTQREFDYFSNSNQEIDFLQIPYVVEVEGTHGCFRECTHCAYEAGPDVDRSKELTTAQLCDIINKLDASGVCTLRFTGGDFLFRRDAIEILQHVDKTNLRYHLLSDTIAFSQSAVAALCNLKRVEYIGSSIDGFDAASHDVWRGNGAFEALIERSRRISDTGVPLLLGATLSKHNYTGVKEIGKVAASVGATYFEIGFLTPIGRAEALTQYVLDATEVRQALRLYLDGMRDGLYKPLQSHYLRRLGKANPFADMENFIDDLPYMTEWPFSRMRVKPTGLTYTAGRLKATPLGFGTNLLTEDVKDIWFNSPNLAYLREIGSGKRMHSLDYREIPMDFRYE